MPDVPVGDEPLVVLVVVFEVVVVGAALPVLGRYLTPVEGQSDFDPSRHTVRPGRDTIEESKYTW